MKFKKEKRKDRKSDTSEGRRASRSVRTIRVAIACAHAWFRGTLCVYPLFVCGIHPFSPPATTSADRILGLGLGEEL
jgi:hypothetical protein